MNMKTTLKESKLKTKPPKILESQLQEQTAEWLKLQHPNALCFHPPNEIQAKPQYMAKRARQGVKKGVADWIFLEPRDIYNGAVIELKVKPNKPTEEQEKFLSDAKERNYFTRVCYTLEEFMDTVNYYLSL